MSKLTYIPPIDPNHPPTPPPHRPPRPPLRFNPPLHNPNIRHNRTPHILDSAPLTHRKRAPARKAHQVRTRIRFLG
jgi:hypothetical protein